MQVKKCLRFRSARKKKKAKYPLMADSGSLVVASKRPLSGMLRHERVKSAQALVRCMRCGGGRFDTVNRAIPDVFECPFYDFLAALSRVVYVGKEI